MMSLIFWIILIIIVFLLVHLWVMYFHAKYNLFKDEQTCAVLHIAFMIIWALMFLTLILFLSAL